MKLSPLELRKHQFAKRFRFRGYDPDEVNGFIRQMADQWADVLEDNRRLEERGRELAGKLSHYEKVELALQEALETSRHTARQVEDNADRKASLTIEEAELRAQRMLQDAEQERYAVKQDLIKLSSRQSEVAARMRAFLMAEMEVLAQFQGDDPSGFIRLVSAHEPGRMAMLSEPASEFGTPDVSASERVSSDTPEEQAADEAKLDSKEEPQEPIATATDPSEPPPVEEPATIVEPPLDEEPTVATERPPIEQPPAAVKPPPIPSAEQRASEPPVPTEVVDVPDGEPSLSRHPIPADSLPIPAPEDPPLTPELVSPVVPPPPAPVPYPVEEPAILAPIPEPAGLPSVEELIAETPSLSQAETAEVDPRPTYRDMLSGTQSAPPTELAEDPFSSSFFESPFPGDEKLGEAHVQAPKPVPGSDSAQQWSLRSVVKGDGDSEPTSSSPSDAERERIRRILEDLD